MMKHAIRITAILLACGLAAWASDDVAPGAADAPFAPDAPALEPLAEVVQEAEQPADTGTDKPEPAASDRPGPAPAAEEEPEKVPQGEPEKKPDVNVSRFDTVNLNVQDADLADILQLLAEQSQRNIVPSPKVTGTVTANLYDVTFYEALEAILQQNGAGFVEKGNFIYVYTFEELAKMREAERVQVHRIFRLNYMTAEDAKLFIDPLVSGNGKVVSMKSVKEGFMPEVDDGGANSNANGEVLLVMDYEENLEKVARTLFELDIPPLQVLVEATILQADLTEDLALGVDTSILANFDQMSGVGSPLAIVNSLINGTAEGGERGHLPRPSAAINTTVGNTGGPGGLKVGILTNNVSVFIRALDEVTDTTIMANPKVLTLNRQRADLLVGDKIGYVSTTTSATSTTETINYLETGTQLTVRPFVSTDGTIRMELKPQISNVSFRQAAGGVSGAVTIPDESAQEVTTNVMVRDGQTIVLGGLFQENTTVSRSQVPGLGNVPILGWVAKGKDDSLSRSEVIFLVTPHIVKDRALAAEGDAVLEDMDRIRLGTRQKLLPWSRTRWSTGHLSCALESLEKGDEGKAMWHVEKALTFDPTLPEALRLREKLSGKRAYQPTSSLLDEAVDMIVDDQTGTRARTTVEITPEPADALVPRPAGYEPSSEKFVPVPVVPPAAEEEDEDRR